MRNNAQDARTAIKNNATGEHVCFSFDRARDTTIARRFRVSSLNEKELFIALMCLSLENLQTEFIRVGREKCPRPTATVIRYCAAHNCSSERVRRVVFYPANKFSDARKETRMTNCGALNHNAPIKVMKYLSRAPGAGKCNAGLLLGGSIFQIRKSRGRGNLDESFARSLAVYIYFFTFKKLGVNPSSY